MSALITDSRLREIETWARGWRNALQLRYGGREYYAELPMDVAVSMIEETARALRDPQRAIAFLAETLHESGQEIAEAVEAHRGAQARPSTVPDSAAGAVAGTHGDAPG